MSLFCFLFKFSLKQTGEVIKSLVSPAFEAESFTTFLNYNLYISNFILHSDIMNVMLLKCMNQPLFALKIPKFWSFLIFLSQK